jgi:hypothetical protein
MCLQDARMRMSDQATESNEIYFEVMKASVAERAELQEETR